MQNIKKRKKIYILWAPVQKYKLSIYTTCQIEKYILRISKSDWLKRNFESNI